MSRDGSIRSLSDLIRFDTEKMAKVSVFETERFFCDLYCLRSGQEQMVHTHAENDKLYLALKGDGEVILGERAQVLTEGEIALAPAGVPHGIRNPNESDWVCLVVMAPHPSGMK